MWNLCTVSLQFAGLQFAVCMDREWAPLACLPVVVVASPVSLAAASAAVVALAGVVLVVEPHLRLKAGPPLDHGERQTKLMELSSGRPISRPLVHSSSRQPGARFSLFAPRFSLLNSRPDWAAQLHAARLVASKLQHSGQQTAALRQAREANIGQQHRKTLPQRSSGSPPNATSAWAQVQVVGPAHRVSIERRRLCAAACCCPRLLPTGCLCCCCF